jgi:hypothetical protein
MRPRRIAMWGGATRFSGVYDSRYRHPVEGFGILLNPESPGSYKIIYTAAKSATVSCSSACCRDLVGSYEKFLMIDTSRAGITQASFAATANARAVERIRVTLS